MCLVLVLQIAAGSPVAPIGSADDDMVMLRDSLGTGDGVASDVHSLNAGSGVTRSPVCPVVTHVFHAR